MGVGAGRGRGGTTGAVGFFATGAIVVGRGIGVGVARDQGQRTRIGPGVARGAAKAVGASRSASSDRAARNFMSESNRREPREAQLIPRGFRVRASDRE